MKVRGLFDMTSDGQFTVTLQQEMIDTEDEMEIAFVVRHELSHALDYVLVWNLSGHPNL